MTGIREGEVSIMASMVRTAAALGTGELRSHGAGSATGAKLGYQAPQIRVGRGAVAGAYARPLGAGGLLGLLPLALELVVAGAGGGAEVDAFALAAEEVQDFDWAVASGAEPVG